ncbi:competence protein ComEC [Rathayibacter iranicus]|uniref:Competence protein ComEC n=2 Tax=Rathayibacter iranicus TaxID=59737 RepID=A0AAD1AFY1_9MICO|nr:competence protein ComEC [Rathayibacter iranicus]MWV31711.1 MBL fold metallo-hydrolase [Rathayibacter iranicus NCPPB 2253 = VKM Ac-1602]PPI48255.1 competence protein ComEC [Rathayibacter iranicus]PPI60886.1 competence protein ComEC [Rathayibacter iranicus]PWJ63288.1 competence protein ComEC [Rathayibacter iranicus] [Rathayibacter iranicus NCPPB 2253 = VKM Ac-1602]
MSAVRAADVRLLPVAVASWAGAWSAGLLPVSAVLEWGAAACATAWLVILLGAGLLVQARRRRGRAALGGVLVAAAGAALAVTSVVVSAPGDHPEALRGAAERRAITSVAVCVDSGPRPLATGGVWFEATALRVGDVPVSAPVRVMLADPGGDIAVASELRLAARVGPGESAVGEMPLLNASAVLDHRAPEGAAGVAAMLRAHFLARTALIGGDAAGLLPGLATGDTSALDAGLEEDMRTASLTHLTAVSGANCALVVVAGWAVAALLGAGRRLRTAAALATLAAFVLLVTPEPSVVRAAVMATVVLLARLGRRSGAAVPALLASVVVLVVADPAIAGRLGFVLSVLATAGLLLLAEPIAATLGRLLPRSLALVLAVPTAAQLACQPVLVLVDPSVPVYGVLANLLAEPAAPAVTGLGLIGCLLAPWWPGGADVAIRLAAVPAWWIAAIARAVASWPSPRLAWWSGLGGAVALSALTLLALVLVSRSARLARLRRIAAVSLACALAATGGTAVATPLLRAASVPDDWRVALCDVGQGDAILLRGDEGVLLVDTGPDPAPLDACLRLLGVERVALLVLTHYDLDHVGGLDATLGRTDSALVGPAAGRDDDRDRAALAGSGTVVREAVRGDAGTLGSLRWRVEWPEGGSALRGNEASVALRVDIGPDGRGAPLSVALLGDLGAEEQGRVARLPVGRVDVVKVAHHGSADQASALYDALGASIGLISVGAGNDYGHPNPSLLALLAERGVETLRSDVEGTVVLASRTDGVVVWASGSGASAAASEPRAQTVKWRRSDGRGTEGRRHGRQSPVAREGGAREGGDPAARLEPDAARPDRPDHGSGGVPGRPCAAVSSRVSARRGSEPRG